MFVLISSHIEFERTFQAAYYNKVDFLSLDINQEIDFKAVSEHVDQKNFFVAQPWWATFLSIPHKQIQFAPIARVTHFTSAIGHTCSLIFIERPDIVRIVYVEIINSHRNEQVKTHSQNNLYLTHAYTRMSI